MQGAHSQHVHSQGDVADSSMHPPPRVRALRACCGVSPGALCRESSSRGRGRRREYKPEVTLALGQAVYRCTKVMRSPVSWLPLAVCVGGLKAGG